MTALLLLLVLAEDPPVCLEGGPCYAVDAKARTVRCAGATPPGSRGHEQIALGALVEVCQRDGGACARAPVGSLATAEAHEDLGSGDLVPLVAASPSRQHFAVLRDDAFLFDADGKLVATLRPPKGTEQIFRGLRFVEESLVLMAGYDMGAYPLLYDGKTGRALGAVGTIEGMSTVHSAPVRLWGPHAWGFWWEPQPADAGPSRLFSVDVTTGAKRSTSLLLPHTAAVAAVDEGRLVVAVAPPQALLLDYPAGKRTLVTLPECR